MEKISEYEAKKVLEIIGQKTSGYPSEETKTKIDEASTQMVIKYFGRDAANFTPKQIREKINNLSETERKSFYNNVAVVNIPQTEQTTYFNTVTATIAELGFAPYDFSLQNNVSLLDHIQNNLQTRSLYEAAKSKYSTLNIRQDSTIRL